MLDAVLIARAAWDSSDALLIVETIDVARAPADRADAYALCRWRRLCPLIAAHGGDPTELLGAARTSDLYDAIGYALTHPTWLLDMAEPTARLVQVFNRGAGTRWRLPLAGDSRTRSGVIIAPPSVRRGRAPV